MERIVLRNYDVSVGYNNDLQKNVFEISCCLSAFDYLESYELLPEIKSSIDIAVQYLVQLSKELNGNGVTVKVGDFSKFWDMRLFTEDRRLSFDNLVLVSEHGLVLAQEEQSKEYFIGKYDTTGQRFEYYPVGNTVFETMMKDFSPLRKVAMLARERQYDQHFLGPFFEVRGAPC